MLTNLFETRNKMFLNLVKLGDYLGRSLRENVELFSVADNSVTYLTESGMAVKGSYDKTALKLTNIVVESSDAFQNKEVYSKLVDSRVKGFVADILANDLNEANDSFESILDIWETRLHFNRIQKRLQEKTEKFNENLNIVNTPEFSRLKEIKKELVSFLKESKNFITIPEIRNTVKLSNVISSSFNIPKITLEGLAKQGKFEVPSVVNHTLYEHLCKQELIAKELMESKSNLENVWITNEKVQKLPSFIYESDDNLAKLMAEIISEIPYFAMATKKQLTSLIESNLDLLAEKDVVSNKDIKSFVSKIFEFKKPIKAKIVDILNEKYGVNVQNLSDPVTFGSLIKTQVLIFESLSKLAPKSSILKKVLSEFSQNLRTKNGVESIDVSDFLNEVFKEANYTNVINETHLMNYLNFDKVADDLGKIGSVLKMIQSNLAGGAGGAMPPGPTAPGAAATPPEGAGKASGIAQEMPPEGESEGEFESDGGELAGMGEEDSPSPDMDSEDAAEEVASEEDEEGGEEGGEFEPSAEGEEDEGDEGEMGGDDEVEFTDKDELVDHLRDLEGLISDLKDQIGVPGEEGGEEMAFDEEGEGEGEEEFGGEEEESPEEYSEDEGAAEEDDGGEEEDEEEEAPNKKGKFPPNK